MKALFLGSNDSPYIIIEFDNKIKYQYKGWELGEQQILKKKYNKKPGTLLNYLKSKSYVKCIKI
jgi:hypothetical protein